MAERSGEVCVLPGGRTRGRLTVRRLEGVHDAIAGRGVEGQLMDGGMAIGDGKTSVTYIKRHIHIYTYMHGCVKPFFFQNNR
jgi:hypothetical protein